MTPFRVAFDVWKPQPSFKKSGPGEPDYRIAVVSARDSPLPTRTQLRALLESTPLAPPPKAMENKPLQRLKHGYRNVLLAVVDQGVVSYMRVSDAAFAAEKIYERAPPGGKGEGQGWWARGEVFEEGGEAAGAGVSRPYGIVTTGAAARLDCVH